MNNFYDLYFLPQFNLHPLTGNRKNQYAFVIHKKSKSRLIIQPLSDEGEILENCDKEKEQLINCVIVIILEVSEHYGK